MSLTRTLAATVAAFGLAATVVAAAQPTTAPSQAQAGVYHVEPNHTRVLFAVDHLGFSTWYGDFTGVSGALVLDPKAPAKSAVEVSIPVASVSTTNAVLDRELKDPTWLDAAKYPTMTFKSTKVSVTGPGRATVDGNLTLHGVTRPVALTATFKGAGVNPLTKAYTVGFEVRGKIKRSEFGVTKYAGMIGDEVTLIISAPFERNKS